MCYRYTIPQRRCDARAALRGIRDPARELKARPGFGPYIRPRFATVYPGTGPLFGGLLPGRGMALGLGLELEFGQLVAFALAVAEQLIAA